MQTGSDHPASSVSVVIAAWTTERLDAIGEAIESVQAQTVRAHEIVLVVDHSESLLAESRTRWPDVTVVSNQKAQGTSGARNTGVAESSGDIVAFLDDDAIAAPDWVERLIAAYADDRVLGVGGTVRPKWVAGRPWWFPAEFDWVVGCTHSGMPRQPAPVRNLVGASMSFRRDVLVEAGGFRQELSRLGEGRTFSGPEDTDFCIQVGQRWPDGVLLYVPEIQVDHTVPEARSQFRYFVTRCLAEGRSKAVLGRFVGTASGLASERAHVRRTLPLAVMRGLRDPLKGDPTGPARALAIGVGLLITSAGYVSGLLRPAVRYRPSVDPNRLRVLMVTPRTPLRQGGVERHVMEVSRRLVADGVDVEVLCAEPGGPARTEQRRDGVKIASLRSWPARSDLYFAPGIWREMKREPRDLVHVQSYHTLVAPLAMLRALTLGLPYFVTFHGGGHTSRLRNRLRRLQRLALRPLLARAERLIAVARFEIDVYSRELRLPRDKFVFVPNGTDLTVGNGAAAEDHPGAPVLASIGRLERYKGHHRVIAALPHVLEQQPDARLLVVGTGPYEPQLRRQAAELGVADRVDFVSVPANDRNGMGELLSGVSIVVLLSEFETHPLVALEAAAARRRLLVADRGGLRELAADGLARTVSPDEAPQAVGQAIVQELAQPAPRRAPVLTSWDDCAAALLELYRSVG